MAVPRQRKKTSLRCRRSRGVERDKKEWSTSKLVELVFSRMGKASEQIREANQPYFSSRSKDRGWNRGTKSPRASLGD